MTIYFIVLFCSFNWSRYIKVKLYLIIIIIIIISIIIIIYCNWVVTRCQWLFNMYKNMKLVTNKYKSGGLHERHVVATWNVGNHLSAFAYRHRENKNLCRGGRSQDLPNTDF